MPAFKPAATFLFAVSPAISITVVKLVVAFIVEAEVLDLYFDCSCLCYFASVNAEIKRPSSCFIVADSYPDLSSVLLFLSEEFDVKHEQE